MHPKKKNRIISLIFLFAFAASGVAIILYNLDESIVFFHPPSEMDRIMKANSKIRVGGLVVEGSIEDLDNRTTRFVITDHVQELAIEYKGALPALFREKQGIVAEGKINRETMIFQAKSLLTKHDENYMPPEVARTMKE